jgi:hypothetical protein
VWARICDEESGKQIRTEEREPECGEDFCDACGDCLVCFGGVECSQNNGGSHDFVVYEKPQSKETDSVPT